MQFTLHRLLLAIVYLPGFVATSAVSKGSVTVYKDTSYVIAAAAVRHCAIVLFLLSLPPTVSRK
jgi:hypothetical protein